MYVCMYVLRMVITPWRESTSDIPTERPPFVGEVLGSRPYEVSEFFSIYLILPAALARGIYSAS
jgi:hypothetical protein